MSVFKKNILIVMQYFDNENNRKNTIIIDTSEIFAKFSNIRKFSVIKRFIEFIASSHIGFPACICNLRTSVYLPAHDTHRQLSSQSSARYDRLKVLHEIIRVSRVDSRARKRRCDFA